MLSDGFLFYVFCGEFCVLNFLLVILGFFINVLIKMIKVGYIFGFIVYMVYSLWNSCDVC